jgi:hypothetical protein
MRFETLSTGLLALATLSNASQLASMSANAQEMFDQSMEWLDRFYDPAVGYLVDVSALQAMDHNTRSSSWYAVGLLARAEGDDIQEAEKVINAIISGQFTDPRQQWYAPYIYYLPIRSRKLTDAGTATTRNIPRSLLSTVPLMHPRFTGPGIQTGAVL